MNRIRVALFETSTQAEPVRARLVQAGVPAEIHDEPLRVRLWFVSRRAAGVRLRVPVEHWEQATRLLVRWDAEEETLRQAIHCPECKSLLVDYPQFTEKSLFTNLAIGLMAGLGLVEKDYYCEHCHCMWAKPSPRGRHDRAHLAPNYFLEDVQAQAPKPAQLEPSSQQKPVDDAARAGRQGLVAKVLVLALTGAASAEQPNAGPEPDRPAGVIPAQAPNSVPEAAASVTAFTNSLFPSSGAKWLNPTPQMLGNAPLLMPFFPHRATTASRSLTPEQFDSAMVCAACHQEISKQWSEAVMSKAWDDPIYRTLLKRASIATQGAVDNFCTGCHTPTGLTTGRINSEINREPPQLSAQQNRVLAGVDCESCHNISAQTGLDNGAYVLTPRHNAEGLPQKYGPRKDAVSPYHKTVYSELHTKSEFCAVCHNVTHPFSSAPIERTFDEWQESPFNATNQNCQSCHMPRFKGKAAVLPPVFEEEEEKTRVEPKERDDVAAHFFAGGNTTLLEHFGLQASAQRSREMLRKAAKIEITSATGLYAGEAAKVQVKVTNEGAGHKLPTGFPEGREVWIDFNVKDGNGNEIFRSGRVRDGKTEEGTRNFKVHLGDAAGHEVDLAVWTVTRILSDNRILPGGYSVVDYDVPVPADVKGPLTIEAVLKYWPFPQKIVDELLGAGAMKVEIVEMASATQRVSIAPTWRNSVPVPTGAQNSSAGQRLGNSRAN